MNEAEFKILRNQMVEEQLKARDIVDQKILEVFRLIPRHKFVPVESINSSYSDCPLSIGEGQTISQPYMVALMTQCLDLKKTDRVLEIGTGSGYQTAILASLANEIFSIERKINLAKRAEDILKELGFSNITIKVGDGSQGWPEKSPFNKIIVTAASPDLPMPLYEQLAQDGKLVIPITKGFSQILTVFTKEKNQPLQRQICGCSFVPLIGKFGYKEKDAL